MEAKFLDRTVWGIRDGGKQGIHMDVCSVGGRWSVDNSLVGEKNWQCVTQTMLESAMECYVFGLAELVVNNEGEIASK
jgi:hypothetical protein